MSANSQLPVTSHVGQLADKQDRYAQQEDTLKPERAEGRSEFIPDPALERR